MEYFTLNNGVRIPAVGTGTNTFGRDDDDLMSKPTGNFAAMESCLKVGYRLYDTAISYRNEEGIGDCLKKSDVPRSELFILGKIPNDDPYNTSPESIRQSVADSMARLKIEYFDLFLIHQAIPARIAKAGGKMDVEKTVALYGELEAMYKEGKFRAIGVSNFDAEQLRVLMEHCKTKPMVNEIRSNPACRQKELVEFCKAAGILPVAHSPLNFTAGAFSVDQSAKADYIAKATPVGEKYGKSWAQVLLRWNYQSGICSIPKSSSPKNQAANLDIFDFNLTSQEMLALN